MNSQEMPLVSVVVTTRERPHMAARCLESIYASDYPRLEVVVVDDNSPPEVAQELSKAFPKARVQRNGTRMLLSASRNAGLRLSHGDFIYFVDDDNVIDKSAISKLVEGALRTGGGVVSPVIYYYSDPKRIWWAGSWVGPVSGLAVFPFRGSSGINFPGPFKTSQFHDTFMVRRSLVDKIGPFDSVGFPIYLSEADFAERMKRRGESAFVIPAASAWHDVPVMEGGRNLLRNMHITEPSRAYYVARNRMIFVKKYRSAWQRFVFIAFFVPALGILHLVSILGSRNVAKIYFVRYYLGGLIAGFRAR